MKVIKAELQGLTASFRYPHFLIGTQPSYRMPPPSTIYGIMCAAAGEWLEPGDIWFGYSFSHGGIGHDYEHIHKAIVCRGKVDKTWGYPKNLEADIDPLSREFLLFPSLTLYIHSPSLHARLTGALQEPRYPLSLGRSQDLACCADLAEVELDVSPEGYYERTLLPWSFRKRTGAGVSMLMPGFIDPDNRRSVKWSRFLLLEQRLFFGSGGDSASAMLSFTTDKPDFVDPLSEEIDGLRRAIPFHHFKEVPCEAG